MNCADTEDTIEGVFDEQYGYYNSLGEKFNKFRNGLHNRIQKTADFIGFVYIPPNEALS